MAPFAGWEMPISYGGVAAEVAAVRHDVGLFDVSHMGEARVTGPGAQEFLQRVTTNDVSRLTPGQAQYSLLLNHRGGVIDDVIVYALRDDEFWVVLNAGCHDKDWDWLTHHAAASSGVHLEDISSRTALIAAQGPEAVATVKALTGAPEMARFQVRSWEWQDVPLILSRTGYTGEDGFEIFCPEETAETLWDALTAQGAAPCGLGARDVLRLEAAYSLYGHELDSETNALECGVGWAIKTNKGDFIGREAVLAAKSQGGTHTRAGLRMTARAIPREGCPVSQNGIPIGHVTSGTFSPTLGAGIALSTLR